MGTTRIECIDCGVPRDVPNASKHLVKRCRDCQDEYNRVRALERYYARTGRSPGERKKKKPKTKTSDKETSGWLASPTNDKGPTHNMSPEEAEKLLRDIEIRAWGSYKPPVVDDNWDPIN